MDEDGQLPERLRNVEPKLVAQICNEILTRDTRITWDDIGEAKRTVLLCQKHSLCYRAS